MSENLPDKIKKLPAQSFHNTGTTNEIRNKQITFKTGHCGAIKSLAFSKDGKNLLSIGEDRLLIIWNTENWNIIRKVELLRYNIRKAVLSPNGNLCACQSDQELLRILEIEKDKVNLIDYKIPYLIDYYDEAINPSGTLFVHTQWSKARIWDITKMKIVDFISLDITAVSFTQNGDFLISGDEHGTIQLWDVKENWKEVWRHRTNIEKITAITISPDGANVIVSDWRLTIYSLDLLKSNKVTILEENFAANCITFSPDGVFFASGDLNGKFKIWKTNDWKAIRILLPQTLNIANLSINCDTSLIAVGNCIHNTIWDCDKGIVLKISKDRTPAITICNDEVFFGFDDQDVDFGTGICPDGESCALAFCQDGSKFATCDSSDKIQIWDTKNWVVQHASTSYDNMGSSITFSPDGFLLVFKGSTDYRGTHFIHILETKEWTVKTKYYYDILEDFNEWRGNLTFSLDCTKLIIGDDCRRLHVWNTTDRSRISDVILLNAEIYSMAFCPDGVLLAIGDDRGDIHLWDITKWRELGSHIAFGSSVILKELCFCPNGSFLAVRNIHGDIRIFEWPAFKLKFELESRNSVEQCHRSMFFTQSLFVYSDIDCVYYRNIVSFELMVTMVNLIKGYLWYTPPCAQAPFGWFYTNRFDLLTLIRKTGDREEVVDHETDEFKDFLNRYNKKEMIVNRLHNPEKYKRDMMLLKTLTISNKLQQHYQLYLADTRIDPVLPSPEN